MRTSHQNIPEKSKQWRTRRAVLQGIVLLLLILMSLPVLLPRLIDSDYVRNKVFGLLGQELGQGIKADHMAITLFPRPGFRLEGVTFHPGSTAAIGIKTALLFPDPGVFFTKAQRPLTGELVVKQVELLLPPPENKATSPLKSLKTATIKTLATHFSYTSLQRFSLDIRGAHFRMALKTTPEQTLSARSFRAEIKKTPELLTMDLDPTAFDAPALILGVGFRKTAHTQKLCFTGDKISVAPLGAMASVLLKQNTIATTLFHTIKEGVVPHITVAFQNNGTDFLFDPEKMVIKGELKDGTIAIPTTKLVATQVMATVQVEKGLLVPQLSRAMVEGARLNQGTLEVDLLDTTYPFKGKFFLTADLGKLPGVLQSLLPDTPLSQELRLTRKIKGSATGTLELTRAAGHLDVNVNCTDIDLSGTYERLPGKAFQLKGDRFSFDRDQITINGLRGTIGTGQLSRVSGDILLTPPHRLDLRTASGVFFVEETLSWIKDFKYARALLTPFFSSRGTLTLKSISLKGPLSTPGPWCIEAQGSCAGGSLYETPDKKGVSDISFAFNILSHGFTVKHLNATIHDMAPVMENAPLFISPELSSLFKDIHTPVTLTEVTLEKNNQQLSFQAGAIFPRGVSMKLSGNARQDHVTLSHFEIKDPPLSNGTVDYRQGAPLIVTGKLDLATLGKCFKPKSATAGKTALPGSRGAVFLTADPEQEVTLFLDHLDLNALLHALSPGEKKQSARNGGQGLQTHTGESGQVGKSKGPGATDRGALPHVDLMPRPLVIHTGTLTFNGFMVSPLVLEVKPLPNAIDMVIKKSMWCGLPITGGLRREENAVKVTLETDVRDVDFTTSLDCLMGTTHLIEGRYDLKTKLFSSSAIPSSQVSAGKIFPWVPSVVLPPPRTSPGPEPQPPSETPLVPPPIRDLLSRCQGPFELYARNGRIFQMTLLSRILSLINVSSLLKAKLPDLVQQGFAYDAMLIKGDITDGRIFIKKGVIDGVDMTLLITGWIDPLQKTMDLLFFISPLKSVDSLIQKLPIINTMFQGDLISIPITAKGNLHDPLVMALSPLEVTKGLLNTLKDILSTPLNLLKKLP